MPPVSSLQFDGRLSNVAVQYQNAEYIGEMVLPSTPVEKKQGKFKQYDKDERFTVPPSLVGPKSIPNEVDWNVSEKAYDCDDYGLEIFVSNEEIDNADAPIQPLSDATEQVTGLVQLDKEVAIANTVFNANNYNAGNQKDIAGAWATLSNDALTDIEAGIDACFMPPNIMVMGIETWRKLSRNSAILAAVKGTLAPQQIKGGGGAAKPAVNIQELAEYLGLDAVLVGSARRNSTKKGQAASYKRVWDGPTATKGGAALLRVSAGSALRDVVWGANFAWKQRQAFTRDDVKGAYGGKMIRVVETYDLNIIAKDVGYLFKDTLAT